MIQGGGRGVIQRGGRGCNSEEGEGVIQGGGRGCDPGMREEV